MANYKARLETLRKVRERARDERRVALAEAFKAAEILTNNREELAQEDASLREWQRAAVVAPHLDVNRLVDAQRYALLLKSRTEELAKQSALLAAETERRRQSLVEADRDVRVLELLDERHRREHNRKVARAEMKQMDESAMVQWRARSSAFGS